MSIHEKLLQLLAVVHDQEIALAESLSETERNQVGGLERWSAKDNLAHIAAWRSTLARNLSVVRSGGEAHRTQDYGQANAEIFAAHQGDPWEQVVADSQRAYSALTEEVRMLNEADLNNGDYFPWIEGRQLWSGIAGNSALHPLTHLAGMLIANRRGNDATTIYQGVLPQLLALDDDPAWQGLVQYDLACILSLAGEKSQAVAALITALKLAPDLKEWSRQDSDLENLHQEPEYQRLYA